MDGKSSLMTIGVRKQAQGEMRTLGTGDQFTGVEISSNGLADEGDV